MSKRFSATNGVLGLLCVMYFITYLDRVNIATAGAEIIREFGMSKTDFGLILSAFAYPYAIFQVIGGSVGDKFGARRTLLACGLIWAMATILTGMVGGLDQPVPGPGPARFRRGRDLPDRHARHAELDGAGQARLRAGHHPRLRAARQRGGPADRRLPDLPFRLAHQLRDPGRGQLRLGGDLVPVLPRRPVRAPGDHPRRARHAAAAPQGRREAERAVGRPDPAHAAGEHHVFLLRLDPVAVPRLAAELLQGELQPRPEELGAVRLGRVLRRRRRRHGRRHDERRDPASDRQREAGPAVGDRGRLPGRGREPRGRLHDPRPDPSRAAPVLGLLLRRTGDRADLVGARWTSRRNMPAPPAD